jgi:transcriptional regulator GlxA family with amidase domain
MRDAASNLLMTLAWLFAKYDSDMSNSLKRVGIYFFTGVEELDAIGPWEVLSYWCQNYVADGYEVVIFSSRGGIVKCAKGLEVVTPFTYETVGELEVVIYPGGIGTRDHLSDLDQLAWVRSQRQSTPLMTSVCTGSLVFAAAGLLANRPATTHWASLEKLAQLDPSIDIRREERFVDDGDVITAAGISAGIDMALHLVERLAGAQRASEVRRGIQYEA